MIENIKAQIKKRIDILEKESIDLGIDGKHSERVEVIARRNELWDLKDFIVELEWKALDDRINYIK